MSQAPQEPPAGPPDRPTQGPGGGRRNPWAVGAVVAAVAALAIVLFLVLRPGDEDDTPDTTAAVQTTTPETTTDEGTTEETTTEEAPATTEAGPPPPQRVVVVVRNGQPVGGVKRFQIEQDRQVVLIVRSDVEDEAHLHGYDLPARVAPGQPARIRFRADQVGVFELELEESALLIAELEVRP